MGKKMAESILEAILSDQYKADLITPLAAIK